MFGNDIKKFNRLIISILEAARERVVFLASLLRSIEFTLVDIYIQMHT